MALVGALRFDAGSLALNLLATVGRRFGEPVERLYSLARLREWLDGVGLTPPRHLTEDHLTSLHLLRTHLDVAFRSAFEERRLPRAALDHINAVAGRPARLESADRRLALSKSVSNPFDPICAVIAQDAIRILVGVERDHVRVCAADDCRMLYLAYGRHARRWCSSERCGNRSRVAAHRAKRAAAGRGSRR